MDLTRNLDLFRLEKRKATYKYWPFPSTAHCSSDKMAAAGFVFIGNKKDNDSVECFVCFKQLDGFEVTDNPMQEHEEHSPACPLVKLLKTGRKLTLNNVLELQEAIVIKSLEDIFNTKVSELQINYSAAMAKAIKTERL